MTATEEQRQKWNEFKQAVQPGDVLHGRVWRRSATWWLVDIGAPFLANLDDAEVDPDTELQVGTPVEVVVRYHHDRKMEPFVSARREDITRAGPPIDLPEHLGGEVVWPPPSAS
jgi:ribosomal protein S1